MRATGPYACPRCGDSSAVPGTCFRCDDPMVDDHGNAGPPPHFEHRPAGVHVCSAMEIENRGGMSSGLEVLAFPVLPFLYGGQLTFDALTGRVAAIRRRRRIRRQLAEAKHVERIADGHDGLVRIAGTVSVLSAVEAPGIPPAAAYAVRRRTKIPCGRCGNLTRVLSIRRGCGRFLIRDDSGAAVVDDDFFEILTPDRRTPDAADGAIRIEDGDAIEVVGRAERRGSDVALSGPSGFRSAATALYVEGSTDYLLKLIPSPVEAG